MKGLRVGIIHHFHETDETVSPATLAGINGAVDVLRQLGADIRDVALSPLQDWHACGTLISVTERAAAYEAWLQQDPERFGERLRDRLLMGMFVTASDYMQAQRRRRELCAELAAVMEEIDILITASQHGEAPAIGSIPRLDNFQRANFTIPFNVAGYPAISVCSGFGAGGLPVAVQMIGRPFEDAMVLRAAHAYETATEWRQRRPVVAEAEFA